MVPEGWATEPLRNYIRIKHGFAFSSEFFDAEGTDVLLTPGNFYEAGGYRRLGAKQKRYSGPVPQGYLLDAGDLLVAMTEQAPGLLGSTMFVPADGRYLHNQRLGKIIPNESGAIDFQYLHCLMSTPQIRRRIAADSGGTKVKHSSPDKITAIEVLIPPLPEQRKIAEILSTWDAAIEKTEALLATAKAQKRALMQSLLIGKRRFPEFEGQPWKEMRLGEMGTTVSGGTPDSTNASYWDGDVQWATPTDITKLTSRFIRKTARMITESGLKGSSAKLVPAGTILICTRATIGEMAIATGPICTNQGFKNLVLSDAFVSDFIFYLLQFFKKDLIRYACGSTFLELSKKDFDKRSFLVPEISEQRRIAAVLNDAEDQIAEHAQSITKLRSEKKALMQQLLTGKRRVVVDA